MFNFSKFLLKVITGEYFTCYWTAAAVVGGSVIGAVGAGKAADTQAEASAQATAEQRRQFDITQAQFAPYREAGARGLEDYERMVRQEYAGEIPGQFRFGAEEFEEYKDPGYEFRLSEGLRALDRRMAKGGLRTSGMRPRALMELGQQMGSQEFGAARGRAYQDYTADVAREEAMYGREYLDPMQRYGNLAQMGMGATQNLAAQRGSYANALSSNIMASGRAQAAGQLGQYGAVAQGLGALGQLYGQSSPQYSPYQNPYVQGDAYAPAYQY